MKRWLLALVLAVASLGANAQALVTPKEHLRGTEQTFLTFPEWFLVFSPAEYASYVKDHTPTQFPFIGHIRQFWSSYATAGAKANDGYPVNFGYHVMILVIGTSTTVEYGLRSGYETIVGRISEATAGGILTEEDKVGAKVAQEYVDFIRVLPWYEFDFMTPLKRLWNEPAMGPGLIRKWERRYALTTEYLVKGGYGWLIKKATKATYEEALLVTAVIVRGLPEGYENTKDVKLLDRRPDGTALVLLPRYQAFMDHAIALSKGGATFEEIAGNRTVLLVSVIVPAGKPVPQKEILFAQPIITQTGTQRVALVVPVSALTERLAALQASGAIPEHVFDY